MGSNRSTKSAAKKSTAGTKTKISKDAGTEKPQQHQGAELSDEQLENVAGGFIWFSGKGTP